MLDAMAAPQSLLAQTCVPKGRYIGTVVAEFLPNGRSIRLRQPLTYVSRCGKRWTVPVGAVSDGASIPALLWRIAGTPLVGLYRDAAVVHDYYCSVRTEPYAAVHQMFYEAMLASGVSAFDAAKFYLGVKLGGPSWDELTIANETLARGLNVNTLPSRQPGPLARRIGRPNSNFRTPPDPAVIARQAAALNAARSVINDDLQKRRQLDSMVAALPSSNIAFASADALDRSAAQYFVLEERQRMAAARARPSQDLAADASTLPAPTRSGMTPSDMMAAPPSTDGPR